MPNDVFLRAILDDPDNVALRLVYADWLDEHGEGDRAAFIRHQCQAARLRPGCPRRLERLRAANELLDHHERNWLGDWSERLVQWEFDRGFVRSVRLTANTFLRYAEALFRAEPVERVELVNDEGAPLTEDAIGEVVASPAFGFIQDCAVVPPRFAILNRIPLDAWLQALAGAAHVNRLRAFGLAGGSWFFNPRNPNDGLDEQALAAFCRAAHLRTLTVLNLNRCPLGSNPDKDRLVSLIAEAPFARRLSTLALEGCRLTERGIGRIATDPVFRRLRKLAVAGNAESPAAWSALCHSSTLDRVRDFSITANHLPQYAGSPAAGRVSRLSVHYGSDQDRNPRTVREAWVRLIATGRQPRQLTLRCHNPRMEVFEEMRRRHWLRELHTLSLRGDSQDDVYGGRTAGVRRLLRPGALPRLARLDLHEVADEKVLAALASWPGLSRLEKLALTDDYHGRLWPGDFAPAHPLEGVTQLDGLRIVTEADADTFLGMPGLEGLRHLSLSLGADFTEDRRLERISAQAIERLLRSPRLHRLTSLSLLVDDSWTMLGHVPALFTDAAFMPGLRKLHMQADGSPQNAVEVLRRRFGLRLVID
jgi:uncharacterized protein (TIGR02996 family)